MAQKTDIKLRRSDTAGKIPTSANLSDGELAINTGSGALYFKKSDGTIITAHDNTILHIDSDTTGSSTTGTSPKVGIGTTSPVAKLDVAGDGAGPTVYDYIYASSDGIRVYGNEAAIDVVGNDDGNHASSILIRNSNDGFGLLNTAAGDSLEFRSFTATADNFSVHATGTNVSNLTTILKLAKTGAITFNDAFTFPTSDGSANQVLQTDGSGNLSFASVSGSGSSNSITDADGDTKIQVEESADEDIIRFDVAGTEVLQLTSDGLVLSTTDVEANEFIGDLRGAVLFKAQAGENVTKGDVVYISGISGNTTVVSKADADDASKMPAFGIVAATTTSGQPVDIYTQGILGDLDTSSYSEGDELFVSTAAGVLTSTPPTGETAAIQKIAKVTRSNALSGSIFITGAGRSNAVPNLDQDQFFLGNASNQAVATDFSDAVEALSINNVVEDTTPQLGGDLASNGNDILFADNDKAVFGAGSDLQVYHNGLASFITDVGTGDLFVRASNSLKLQSADGENYLVANANGAVTLYYNNSAKLATTSTGINVTGTVTSDGLTVDGVGSLDNNGLNLELSSSNTGIIYDAQNGYHTFKRNGTNALQINGATGDISFYDDTGTSKALYWDASAESLFIGATSASALNTFSDDLIISNTASGTGAGISIVSNATNGYSSIHFGDTDDADIGRIQYNNATNVMTFRTNAADRGVIDSSGNFGIGTSSPQNNSGRTTLTISNSTNGGILEIFGASDTRQLLIYNTTGESRFETLSGGSEDLVFRPNGSEQMRVTSTGIDVTGTATMDGLTVEGTATTRPTIGNSDVNTSGLTTGLNFKPISNIGDGAKLNVISGLQPTTPSPYTAGFEFVTHDWNGTTNTQTKALTIGASGDISFYDDTGTSQALFWDASAESLGIGTTSPNQNLEIKTTSGTAGLRIHADHTNAPRTALEFMRGTSDTFGGDAFTDWKIGHVGSDQADFAITSHDSTRGENERVTIEYTTGNVGIGTTSPKAKLQVEEYGVDTTETSTTATTQVAIHTFAATDFRSARFTIQASNSTDSTYHISEILLVHDGTTPTITEYGTVFTGSASEATFDADISSGNVRLLATPASTDSIEFKVICHSVTV